MRLDALDWQDTDPLPEGDMAIDAVAVITVMPGDGGKPYLALRSTKNLPSWTALGMLRAAFRTQDDDIAESFREDEGRE